MPDLEGAKVFRAALVLGCIGAAIWLVTFAAIASWLGAW